MSNLCMRAGGSPAPAAACYSAGSGWTERLPNARQSGGRRRYLLPKRQVLRAAIFQTLSRIGRPHRTVRRRRRPRRRERRPVRVRARPAADRRARRLRAQHHHTRRGPRGRAHRRVRRATARHHRLRRHPGGAAAGDHRRRGRRVLRAQRHQRARHHPRRHPGRAAGRALQRREHPDDAARAQRRGGRPGPRPREGVEAEAARDVLRDPSREALHQTRDPRPLREPGLAGHRHARRGRRRGGGAAPLRQVRPRRRAGRGRGHRGHHSGPVARQPARQHGWGHRAAQLRAAAHGGGGLHHGGSSRRGDGQADRARPASATLQHDRTLLSGGDPPAPRERVRRPPALPRWPRRSLHARHRPAAGRQPRRRRRAPGARQATGIPRPPAQRSLR